MLEENPDPDFGVNDEADDILCSGVEDNEGDDGDEGGDGGEGGVGQANLNQEGEQPVNAGNNQVLDGETENEVPVVNESETVKGLDQDKQFDTSLNENEPVKESKNVQVDIPVATSDVEATTTTNTPVKRKEVEAEKTVPCRPPPSKARRRHGSRG
ncbi:hypothetical protein L1987_57830 [Smallanthus sonchifolius]|uniref:Uncharacterized protein n=1 Tax=Smallanthus sonchifolius TaxID=185202 RepID=A0ACB9DDN5_9ASTR|nr:hypothetical protein L1987_57830 [Smallanthus sonchifolius]